MTPGRMPTFADLEKLRRRQNKKIQIAREEGRQEAAQVARQEAAQVAGQEVPTIWHFKLLYKYLD